MSLERLVRNADLPAVAALLLDGADPNRRGSEGLTPLMQASAHGRTQLVDLLLTAGADALIAEPRMGATALHKAALSGSADTIALLLDHGAFIDQQTPSTGHTPLMDAVLAKHTAAVNLLLSRGAKTTLRAHAGQTALDYARQDSQTAIATLIEERNAADRRLVASRMLVDAVRRDDVAGVRDAIAAGASLDERLPRTGDPDDDFTPLGLAAREGREEIVRLLLDAGADPRCVNGMMRGTPAHEAAYFGHAGTIRILAASTRDQVGVKCLDLDAQGAYNGYTALHDAVWHGHAEATRALVEAGASLLLRSHTGLTARELALAYGYGEIAAVLAEAESAR